MRCIELNREGNFDRWDHSKLMELRAIKNNVDAGNKYTIYQNENMRLSVFVLESYQRLPFTIVENDFSLISLTGGLAITRFSHGGISLLMFRKGEYVNHVLNNTRMVNDFQNIGEGVMIMAVMEYRQKGIHGANPINFSKQEPVFVP